MAQRKSDRKAPSLLLAVSLALCTGAVLAALTLLIVLVPNQVRCVVKAGGTIQEYGVTGRGRLAKAAAVDLVTEGGVNLWTRCGLKLAAPVKAMPASGATPAYLQTVADGSECGNLETLPDCDRMHLPLIGALNFSRVP